MQEQATNSNAESSRPSSSERSSSSLLPLEPKKGMESDEDISIVPEMGSDATGPSTCGRDGSSVGGSDMVRGTADVHGKRGRSQADKETKRLKRLLRNRVSAQQARERKKVYLKDLEVKNKHLEEKNSELEERLSTLKNENQMLRHILKNTTVSKRGSNSSTEDVFL